MFMSMLFFRHVTDSVISNLAMSKRFRGLVGKLSPCHKILQISVSFSFFLWCVVGLGNVGEMLGVAGGRFSVQF
jgi:hypothetical protein